jgi:acetyl-CoA carboxylase biotin carboxylase subunit
MHLPAGPGIRWDGGIEAGSEIGLFYDPMVGKLIVHAPTRDAAIERMRRALLELTITGIETSRDFHLRLMENEEFRRGDIDIQWLERHLPELTDAPVPPDVERVAIVAAALVAERHRNAPLRSATTTVAAADSPWLRAARSDGLR